MLKKKKKKEGKKKGEKIDKLDSQNKELKTFFFFCYFLKPNLFVFTSWPHFVQLNQSQCGSERARSVLV